MNFAQKLYDWIKGVKTPIWLRDTLSELQNIILSILIQVGQDYIQQIQSKILEVSKLDISSRDKFRMVFSFGKELIPTIKDSALNLVIESLFNRLKKNRAV